MRIALTLLCIAAVSGIAPAVAAETARIPYHLLSEGLARVQEIERLPSQQHDRVEVKLTIQSHDTSVRPVRLWMEMGAREIEVPIQPDGSFVLPQSPEIKAADPLVRTNQPKGTMELSFVVQFTIPPQPFRYASLVLAADQADAIIARNAGILGFLTPRSKGVAFQLAAAGKDCALTLRRGSGAESSIAATGAGRIELRFDRALARDDPWITTSCPVQSVAPMSG